MKKFKALFAAAVIVVVAGASALFWYLGNDRSDIPDTSEPDGVISADTGDDENYDAPEDAENGEPDENGGEEQTTQDNGENKEDSTVSVPQTDINEFLSVFSRVYFAETYGVYPSVSHNTYELIRFAYSHLRRTDSGCIINVERPDNIHYYSGVPYDKVNAVLAEYLGVSVGKESADADTGNGYAFFEYADGYFYTPAADGLGYTNLTVADSVSEDGDIIRVKFTAYSDGVTCDMTGGEAHASGAKYSSGTAELKRSDDGFVLVSYELDN